MLFKKRKRKRKIIKRKSLKKPKTPRGDERAEGHAPCNPSGVRVKRVEHERRDDGRNKGGAGWGGGMRGF